MEFADGGRLRYFCTPPAYGLSRCNMYTIMAIFKILNHFILGEGGYVLEGILARYQKISSGQCVYLDDQFIGKIEAVEIISHSLSTNPITNLAIVLPLSDSLRLSQIEMKNKKVEIHTCYNTG
jgi:hypothetical protein